MSRRPCSLFASPTALLVAVFPRRPIRAFGGAASPQSRQRRAIGLAHAQAASSGAEELLWWLNGGFAVLYLASAAFTYGALKRPARAF